MWACTLFKLHERPGIELNIATIEKWYHDGNHKLTVIYMPTVEERRSRSMPNAALPRLFTIGYQGTTPTELLTMLQENQVDILIDVRYLPWSRNPSYCKSPLSRFLEQNHINYIHLRQLGNPPLLRRQLHETGDWVSFAEAYLTHLKALNGTVESALAPLSGHTVCLMCMEADPAECHRSLLAGELVDRGIAARVDHLLKKRPSLGRTSPQ